MLDYDARGRFLQPYNFNLTGAETGEGINYRYVHETARLFLVSTFKSPFFGSGAVPETKSSNIRVTCNPLPPPHPLFDSTIE